MKRQQSKTYAWLQLCAAGAILAPLTAAAAAAAPGQVTDRMIVKYKETGSGTSVAAAATRDKERMAIVQRAGQQLGLNTQRLHTAGNGAQIIGLERKMSIAEVTALARELKARDPSVDYAEPDRIMLPLATASDPHYLRQWHYFEANGGLRLPGAWDQSTGGGVIVAVVDSGYRPHADLSGQFAPGYDFISNAFMANDGGGRDADAQDPGDATAALACGDGKPVFNKPSSWHGTHVAGTIAARTNNGIGVAGVAYNARLLPVRVLGRCGGYTSDIADGIIWASGGPVAGAPSNPNRARVINLSLGGEGVCDATTQAAIDSARGRGAVVVVAAGNDNVDAGGVSPANCAGVITVGANGRNGARASYSNFGAVVDVSAPGGDTDIAADNILSTINTGSGAPLADGYAYSQGTSMAAPHVSGVAALMLARNQGLKPEDLEARLKQSTRRFAIPCTGCGTGIVDAAAAVWAAAVIVEALFEVEANNTIASANPIGSTGNVVGNIGSATDTDHFLVQLPAGKTLTAVLTPFTSSADYDLYVVNASEAQLGASERGPGLAETVAVTNTGSATVARYVRVKYYSGVTGASNGKYTLKLTW